MAPRLVQLPIYDTHQEVHVLAVFLFRIILALHLVNLLIQYLPIASFNAMILIKAVRVCSHCIVKINSLRSFFGF